MSEVTRRGNQSLLRAIEQQIKQPMRLLYNMNYLVPKVPPPPKQIFSEKKKETLKNLGATESEGRWTLPDGREVLNKAVTREILIILHRGSHWRVQAMCDAVLQKYVSIGIYTLSKQVYRGCVVYQKVNNKAVRNQPKGGRELGF